MEFEWDPDKAASNFAKHGVSFDVAFEFDWNVARFYPDDRFDYGELRILAIGPDLAGDFYAVLFTFRDLNTRIISARKANKKEIARWRSESEM